LLLSLQEIINVDIKQSYIIVGVYSLFIGNEIRTIRGNRSIQLLYTVYVQVNFSGTERGPQILDLKECYDFLSSQQLRGTHEGLFIVHTTKEPLRRIFTGLVRWGTGQVW
jgi:hypothetical protein